MKEWTIQVPVEGVIVVKICAETSEEALQIFYDKQEQLMFHPSGILNPISHKLAMYTTSDDKLNS